MKSRRFPIFLITIVLTAGLGCGLIDQAQKSVTGSEKNTANNNKSLGDRAVDAAVGEKKVGVPECDEVLEAIEAELNNSEGDLVSKAVKSTVLNQIKDGIRESVARNKSDKAELAKACRKFRMQFERYKNNEAATKE